MKIHTTILVAGLIATAGVASQAFAQAPAAPAPAASAPASKEAVQQDQAQLSPEKAKLYNDAMQQAMDGNRDLREQIRKAHESTDAILTAEKFDKNAFLANAAELDQLYAKMREKTNAAFISVVEKFSQEDRKILVKARNDRRHRIQVQNMQ